MLRENEEFGDCNNFKDSNVDHICTEFATEIEKIIGPTKLLIHTVDLTSDDGLKCYGTVERKMSLLTTDLYRRWVEILDKHKLNKWWWLATAYSTPKHDDDDWVKCVSPSGNIGNISYNFNGGVRPYWWNVRQSRQEPKSEHPHQKNAQPFFQEDKQKRTVLYD